MKIKINKKGYLAKNCADWEIDIPDKEVINLLKKVFNSIQELMEENTFKMEVT